MNRMVVRSTDSSTMVDFLDASIGYVLYASFAPGAVPDDSGMVRDSFEYILTNKWMYAAFVAKIKELNRLAQSHQKDPFAYDSVFLEYEFDAGDAVGYAKVYRIDLPPQLPAYIPQGGLSKGVIPIVISRELGYRKIRPISSDVGWTNQPLLDPLHVAPWPVDPLGNDWTNWATVTPHDYVLGLHPDWNGYFGPNHFIVAPEDIEGDLPSTLRIRSRRYFTRGRPGGLIAKRLVKDLRHYFYKSSGPWFTSHWRSRARTAFFNYAGHTSWSSYLNQYKYWNGSVYHSRGDWHVYGATKTDTLTTLEIEDERYLNHYGRFFHGSGSTSSPLNATTPWRELKSSAYDVYGTTVLANTLEYMGIASIPRGDPRHVRNINAPNNYNLTFQTRADANIGDKTLENHGFFMLPAHEGNVFRYANLYVHTGAANYYTVIDGEYKTVYTYDNTGNLDISHGGAPYGTGDFFTLTPGYYNIFYHVPLAEATVDPLPVVDAKPLERRHYGPPFFDWESAHNFSFTIDVIPRWQFIRPYHSVPELNQYLGDITE